MGNPELKREKRDIYKMKRACSLVLTLVLVLSLMPAASAENSIRIPDLASYSKEFFTLKGTTKYDLCMLHSYEAAADKTDAVSILRAYIQEFIDGDFSLISERVIAETEKTYQSCLWLRYEGKGLVTPFGFQLQDYKINSCDVFLMITLTGEKSLMDVYFAHEMEMVDYSVYRPAYGPMPAIADGPMPAIREATQAPAPTLAPTAAPTALPTARPVSRSLVASPVKADRLEKKPEKDNAFIQDLVDYADGRLEYEALKTSDHHNMRSYSGEKSEYAILQDYVNLLLQKNPYLQLVEKYELNYSTMFFSYGINYTGNVNMGRKINQTHTDNECHMMIYGSIKRSKLEFTIWTPKNLELLDLGYRYGKNGQEDVSIAGESALAGLYALNDGSFETSDGRLKTSINQAMILRDGVEYTTEATFERDRDDELDRIWARYFYRNETIFFSIPLQTMQTGDIFRLQDVQRENSWLLRDNGILDKEGDFTGYNWSDCIFLGVNHGGEWMTPVRNENTPFQDATIRVMYQDEEVAVVYFYIEFSSAPHTLEALCAVSKTGQKGVDTDEADADYVTYVGQKLDVHFGGTEFGATYNLYQWEIISGESLIALSHEKSETCTLEAKRAGTVRLRMTYRYGKKEPDILTGRETTNPRSKTQEYVIIIH